MFLVVLAGSSGIPSRPDLVRLPGQHNAGGKPLGRADLERP
jgi:hypothetical protein